jgi:hypothetical protein
MAKYVTVRLALTKTQLGLLKNSIENETGCTLIITAPQLEHEIDAILVTPAQNAKILAARAAKKHVTVKISAKCMQAMREQVGNGILDSLGNLFNSVKTSAIGAANSVKNAASSAWRNITAPSAVQRGRNYTVTTKNPAPAQPERAQEFDNKPPAWRPKPPSFADRVQNFDTGINKFFGYPSNAGTRAWKQQVAAFPDRAEDF